MTATPFFTLPRAVWDLEPGDLYLTVGAGGKTETREVLGIIQRTSLNGALLEVRDPRGDVFRSHMNGTVQIIEAA